MYFLSFRSFEQLALALKTEFALKIFKSVGAAAPRPSASYAYGLIPLKPVENVELFIVTVQSCCKTTVFNATSAIQI